MKKLRLSIAIAICALFCCLSLFACGGEKLRVPSRVVVNPTSLTLSWIPVKGAESYIVSRNGEEIRTADTKMDLSILQPGTYTLKVRALSTDKSVGDSDFSEPITFVREKENGLVFRLVNNSSYEVASVGTARGDIVIPDVYRTKPVTKIVARAFASSVIRSVSIGNNVTDIGENAFYNCAFLTTVTLGTKVANIGKSAFESCSAIEEITIPSTVKTIPDKAFRYCRKLTKVTISEGVTAIGESAFADCSSLSEISISNTITSLGALAFNACSSLTSITVPGSIKDIPSQAFFKCAKLTTVVLSEGVESIGDQALAENVSLNSISLPSTLKFLGESAFAKNVVLTEITLPDSLMSIPRYAFYGCKLLEKVDFGDNIVEIGQFAFYGTNLLTADEKGFIFYKKWLIGTNNLEIETLDIPNDTVGFAAAALADCAKLSAVFLPKSVKYIGLGAFYRCTMLVGIDAPGVRLIGSLAFSGCSRLKTVKVYSGLEVIGPNAFNSCTALSSITLPSTIKRIGQYAFYGSGLWNSATGGIVYAGNWVVDVTEMAPPNVKIQAGTVGIADFAFYEAGELAVTLPSTIKIIGRCAFRKAGIIAINIPEGITEIGEYMFAECTALTGIKFPSTLKKIGLRAFSGCTALEYVTFGGNEETISDYAFYKCSSLASNKKITGSSTEAANFVMPTNLNSIGAYSFSASGVQKVTLPDALTSLSEYAFNKCALLQEAVFGTQLKNIGRYAFANCEKLERVSFPNSVKNIGDFAFYRAVALTEVNFGSVENIGASAFYGGEKLKSIVFPDNLKTIGKSAFSRCIELESVTLPSSIEVAAEHAFYYCVKATFYYEADQVPAAWGRWNSSYRPVIYGCKLADDNSVVSFVKPSGDIANHDAKNGITMPSKAGYEFVGWSTASGSSEVKYFAGTINDAPEGTTLYAVWKVKESPAA